MGKRGAGNWSARARKAVDAAWSALDVRDLHVYGGVALAGYGANIIHPGVGWFVAGAALFYIALWRTS
jgi:hypothetical protein